MLWNTILKGGMGWKRGLFRKINEYSAWMILKGKNKQNKTSSWNQYFGEKGKFYKMRRKDTLKVVAEIKEIRTKKNQTWVKPLPRRNIHQPGQNVQRDSFKVSGDWAKGLTMNWGPSFQKHPQRLLSSTVAILIRGWGKWLVLLYFVFFMYDGAECLLARWLDFHTSCSVECSSESCAQGWEPYPSSPNNQD